MLFRTIKNVMILLLLWGVDIPDHPYLTNLMAQVSDELGLLAYPDAKSWTEIKELWQNVKSNDGRPLSEMLMFPDGRWGDQSLYMIILAGKISPERSKARDAIDANVGYFKELAQARYDRIRWLYRVYDLLDDLTRPIPLWQKRIKLSELRDMLGDEMYFKGAIPEPDTR